LGYTLGRCWSTKTGRAYIGTKPSRRKVKQFCQEISLQTERRWNWRNQDAQVEILNRMIRGWSTYFCLGPVNRAYEAIDAHCRKRLRQWLRRKHTAKCWGYSRVSDEYLHETLGLIQLKKRTQNLPWAKA